MKLFGAFLIILSATSLGFYYAKQLRDRPRQLRQLKVALQSLEAEMMYGLLPLAIASERIAKQLKAPISHLFERFSIKLKEEQTTAYEAWQQSLEEIWRYTALLESEREVLTQFGATLGQHDREQQKKHITLALTHLTREEMEARERQIRYERMFKSLGFLSGLLLVMFML